jgi:hypothetical protein
MTGSISYKLVDLVWINRMQNKLNEMKHVSILFDHHQVIVLNTVLKVTEYLLNIIHISVISELLKLP